MPSFCCLFITGSNCRTASLGWGGRTQFDLLTLLTQFAKKISCFIFPIFERTDGQFVFDWSYILENI